ncbi:hypothetical protein A0U92_13930 [Acetobacter aceti]|uniref:Uncharacterized protein n=1 Tax=Acetobacter aceti TaxID=435 RepID=A0A1U9KIU9_ACEAC|nr:hypothetical protein A0U92_13930 [Acetobacter aceti]
MSYPRRIFRRYCYKSSSQENLKNDKDLILTKKYHLFSKVSPGIQLNDCFCFVFKKRWKNT